MKYAIGDIHGCLKTLKVLLKTLNLKENDELIFLGDYIDRGPDSKGVLDLLMGLKNARFLMGNHEDLMLAAIQDKDLDSIECWYLNGGTETKRSFEGFNMDPYLEFIKKMEGIIQVDGYYLAHAGANPFDPMKSDIDTLLWDRGCFAPMDGTTLVVGHCVTNIDDIKRTAKYGQKIVIDGGCVYDGCLVALRLDDKKLFYVNKRD